MWVKVKWFGITMLCLIPVVTAAVGLFYYWEQFDSGHFSTEHGEWGQFGDFIGGIVNPSVGLVTIILLVLTLISQQTELREQRKQMTKQSFEQTFFSWLGAYHQAIKDMKVAVVIDEKNVELRGIQVMEHLIEWDNDLDADLANIEEAIRISKTRDTLQKAQSRLKEIDLATWNSKAHGALRAASIPARMGILLLSYVSQRTHLTESERLEYIEIFQTTVSETELGFFFLSHSQRENDETMHLMSNCGFLYFLNPHGQPLISALLRHGVHNFPEAAFDSDVLARLRADF
ncbi:hypothetical protein [Achromobacter dolens]|uniref:hypothetical protein n=1 Tax=Achromobacter dolens TaxID=1287738 RepID=UPI00300C7C2D